MGKRTLRRPIAWIAEDVITALERGRPRRLGGAQPEDAAKLVAFLCSPEGRWITGQVLLCNGGVSVAPTLRRGRRPLD